MSDYSDFLRSLTDDELERKILKLGKEAEKYERILKDVNGEILAAYAIRQERIRAADSQKQDQPEGK